jgi:hypothetical protein
MGTKPANPATRAGANRGLVTRPLAKVLLAMGAISLAAAPGLELATPTATTVAATSDSTPATATAGLTVTDDETLAAGDRRVGLSE